MRPEYYTYQKRKPHRRGSKIVSQKEHAYRRLKQRFGIILTDELHKEFIKKIISSEGKFVEKQSCRVSVWDVKYEGQTIRLVYDKVRKVIITCLSEELGKIGEKIRKRHEPWSWSDYEERDAD